VIPAVLVSLTCRFGINQGQYLLADGDEVIGSGCPVATGKFNGSTLGLVRLG
jgi:hypothetical protein